MHTGDGWIGSLAVMAALGLVTGCVGVNHDGAVTGTPVGRPGAADGRTPGAAMADAEENRIDAKSIARHDKAGFYTQLDPRDGRLWVFKEGSEDLARFKSEGKPAKQVIRPGAGPGGLTIKSVDSATLIEYVAGKPGFVVYWDGKDDRLWVFAENSQDLATFKAEGKPAKQVLRPNAGPFGLTLKSTESETIIEYVVAKEGFYTRLDKDGRLWVFQAGSQELYAFKARGKPAKHVVRPGAGPLGLTLKGVDSGVLDAYQAAF